MKQRESTIRNLHHLIIILLLSITIHSQNPAISLPFNFSSCLYDEQKTLSCFVSSLDTVSGEVTLNGYDARRPPFFTFLWDNETEPETGACAQSTPGLQPGPPTWPGVSRPGPGVSRPGPGANPPWPGVVRTREHAPLDPEPALPPRSRSARRLPTAGPPHRRRPCR